MKFPCEHRAVSYVMASDFITKYEGLFELKDEELGHESDANPSIRKYA